MQRQCLACGQRPAATTPEWPALCQPCLDRAGERIEPAEAMAGLKQRLVRPHYTRLAFISSINEGIARSRCLL